MEILYYIINFLILAGIIVLFGRKTIVSIFRNRRTKINSELDRAEGPLPEAESIVLPDTVPADNGKTVEEAKRLADEKTAKLRTYTELECRELSLEKAEKTRKAVLALFAKKVENRYGQGDYAEFEKKNNERMMKEILGMIRLTPGDMSYLKHHDVLYVTLTSAHPLDKELVELAGSAVSELLSKVNGRMSFWVREDPSLIEGLTLRIGDTVYDATAREYVYRVSKAVEKNPVLESDTLDDLISNIETQVENVKKGISVYQLGRVISVSDGICWMDGLADIMYGEVIEFECGERGMVLDIQKDKIGCVIFGRFEHIESYSKVRRVGRIASVPVGDAMLGRVVDAIGKPIDGKGTLRYKEKRPIEFNAPGILDRSAVSRPLHTGIKAIDALVPIGKGQRELLVGDRQTGKTAIVLDAVLSQKGNNVVCIYVCIGQKETTVSDFKEKLEKLGVLDYTVVVSATASESAAMQYIAPFAATAIGEYFMYSGRDVLIIYDDLSKHAVAYRELSLLLQRPSGREAYPGDIFYLHSRLLERSAQLKDELGGGSMTALPIIETQAGDISSYIPTNIISITDGQIFLEADLFRMGQRPAVNVGLSVSRVGGAAQTKLMKQVSSNLRTKLAQYRELAEFTQFGADIDDETRKALNSGEHLTEALKQNRFSPIDDWKMAILLYSVSNGFTDNIPTSRLREFEERLSFDFEKNHSDIVSILSTGKKMTQEVIDAVEKAIKETAEEF